jgi:hypothetical protein
MKKTKAIWESLSLLRSFAERIEHSQRACDTNRKSNQNLGNTDREGERRDRSGNKVNREGMGEPDPTDDGAIHGA